MGLMSLKTRDSAEPELPAKLSGYLDQDRLSTISEVRWVTMLWVGDPAGGLLCPSWTVSILSSSLAWCLKPGSLLPWNQLMPTLQDDHVCKAWSCLPLVSSHITRPGCRGTANSVLALGMWGWFPFH